MENFGELSDFMDVVMAGPEKMPAWLKDFGSKPIGITVKFKAKLEHRNDFVKAMKRHQQMTIEQEGVEAVPHFKLHTSPFDAHVFYLVEEWASAKALKKHFVADYMAQLVGEMKIFLVPSSESQSYVSLYDLGFEERSCVAVHSMRKSVGSSAEPMENFAELSDFMDLIMAGPENVPAWLKDFDTKPIGITVKFKAKPEHRNDFVKAMKRHQQMTIEQEGVEAVPHFKLHTSPFDAHVFYLVEEWASAKALKKHFVADYMAQLVSEMKVFLVPSSESHTYVSLYDLGFEERMNNATFCGA
jgi:quinol monooxygenase YgiN